MASVFDADGLQIGSIEATADGVVAFDIDGKRIGLFETHLEAVSAVFAAWRLDGEPRSEQLLLAIEALAETTPSDEQPGARGDAFRDCRLILL